MTMKKVSLVGTLRYLGGVLIAMQGILLALVAIFMLNNAYQEQWKEYGKTERKHAFAQYFIAAGFNILFAFTIWYIPSMIELLKNGKGTKKPIRKKSELQIIKEEDEKISNNNNDNNIIKENTNSDINTNSDDNFAINNTNSGLSLGMKET